MISYPYGKNRGAAHFATHGLQVGNGVGCPWAAHGNFAMQIRLPTTSIHGNSGQPKNFGNSVGSPLLQKNGKSGQLSGQRSGLPMGILPCKLDCPLLPYMENGRQLSGQPTTFKNKKWAAQLAVECADHGLTIGILPCK